MNELKVCLVAILTFILSIPLYAQDNNGTLTAPLNNGYWRELGRWKEAEVDSKKIIFLIAGTSYAALPIKELPSDKNLILEVECYVKSGGYSIGIGGWGSPTLPAPSRETGWYTDRFVFSAESAHKFFAENKLSLLFQKAGEVGFKSISIKPGKAEDVIAIYREFVTNATKSAMDSLKKGTLTEEITEDKGDYQTTEKDNTNGFIPFTRSYLKFVYPRTIPATSEVSTSVNMVMGQGEYEPSQIAIRPLKDFSNVTAELSGLPNDITGQVYWAEMAPKRIGGSRSKKMRVQPNRLWPKELFPSCNLQKETCNTWWVILKTEKNTKAGDYKISVNLKTDNKPLTTYTINVKVLPIALPDKVNQAIFLCDANMIDEESTIKALADHGQNSMATFADFAPIKNGNVDFTVWDDYFAKLKKYNISNSFFWYLGNPESGNRIIEALGREKFIEMLKGIESRVKDGKYPAFFALTIDEAVCNSKALSQLKDLNKMIKENAPTLKCQGTSLDQYSHTVKYEGTIDILACNGSFEQNRDWCKEKNVLLSTYSFVAANVDANHTRLNYGFLPWRLGCRGVNGWAMRWFNGNPFDDSDAGCTDWNIFFPNWSGAPVSTPSWEGFREGVDDFKYLTILEELVAAGKSKGESLKDLKENGVGKMDIQKEKVVGDSVFGASAQNANALEQARMKVMEEILKATK